MKTCIIGQGPAPNINQVLIPGKLSIANYNHNIRNIIRNLQSDQTGMFVGRGENISQGWICIVSTQVTYIPFMTAFPTN